MATWTQFGNWMEFKYLDGGGANLGRCYTAAYKITDEPDAWSNRFSRFKAKEDKAIERAIALMEFGVPQLLESLGMNSKETILLPALSSSETKAAAGGPLARIAAACANRSKARWSYHALTKKVHRPLHTLRSAAARKEELVGADYKAHAVEGSYNAFIIVDDFITRGDTLSCAADAIKKLQPSATVLGIALGKTERKSWNAQVSNGHVPAAFDAAWSGM